MDCILCPQTRTAMGRLTEALDTMHEALLTSLVLGQPPVTVKRDGMALAVSKMTGRSMNNFTLAPDSGVDLQMDTGDETADTAIQVKVSGWG